MEMQKKHSEMQMNENPYRKLLIMAILSFISMYILMYAMVNVFGNIFNSFNQFYMAGLMTAPMLVIEVLLMGSMYKDKRKNAAILAISVILGMLFLIFIRQQTAITDKQFLRSMIPHHSGAILMCEQSPISDAEIKELCQSIIKNQESEIDQMKAILDRLQE